MLRVFRGFRSVRSYLASSSLVHSHQHDSFNHIPSFLSVNAGSQKTFSTSSEAKSPAPITPQEAQELTMRNFLNDEQKALLTRIRAVLDNLGRYLYDLELDEEDRKMLRKSIYQLEELFLFVVVGEFNSGKSNFINALLGVQVCQTGVLPTTERVNILRYGEKEERFVDPDVSSMETLRLRVPFLKETNVVDTPGTNAVLSEHQQITEHFVPRSDIVCFVTSVDRPFSETERQFLQQITAWKKKVVVVLNKIDVLAQQDHNKVLDFVRVHAKEVLSEVPNVFPVSSKRALAAKLKYISPEDGSIKAEDQNKLKAELEASGFQDLQAFITDTVSGASKIRLKLQTPLGVGDNLLRKYRKVLNSRDAFLRTDQQVMKVLNDDLEQFETDMKQDFEYQLDKIDNVFLKMQHNANTFVSDHLQMKNIFELTFKRSNLQATFDQKVNEDVNDDLQDCINGLIDWIIERTNRQASSASRYLTRAKLIQNTLHGGSHDSIQTTRLPSVKDESLMATLGENFHSHRQGLLDSLKQGTRSVFSSDEREKQTNALSDSIKSALVQFSALEAGALGVGALVSASLLDITGLAGAGILALSGLYMLPYQRSQLQKTLDKNIENMKGKMGKLARRHFENELDAAVQQIRGRIMPYSRWVRIESGKIEVIRTNLAQVEDEMKAIREDVRRLTLDDKGVSK